MKTSTLFKSIATLAIAWLMGTSAFAQVTAEATLNMVAPAGTESIDTVAVGSVMPYRVTGDLNMHSLRALGVLNASNFTKTISGGGTIRNLSGVAASTPLATDSAISVAWGTTAGTYTLSFTEVPQVAGGDPFTCTANTVNLNVEVVERPTVGWNGSASASGCGVDNTTVTIPYRLNGIGQFIVTYRIQYTALNGTVSDVVTTAAPVTVGDYKPNTNLDLNLSYTVPAAAYGKYEVFITNITDRISRKSFGNAFQAPGTDFPAAATVFYAYPTPVTSPIQHKENL